ncbi:protein kinase domain-containing protein [Streptomyces sp. NPDC001595]|uniref:protein kinase domain-containing protein n=1 Tax=Streptomyces sp. NPDC001532 TaxID=3154520 RepID=UPI003325CAB2
MTVALTVVSASGREWRLTQRIGSGSEGVVYGVDDARPLVAKLVPDPPDPAAYRRRIARLVRQRREPRTVRLLTGTPERIAWPLAGVRAGGPGADGVDGYVMTDMRHAHQPFTHLLTPADHRVLAPRATWATALTAAASLARLLADLHAEGYVVGDLKPDNLWVDARGDVGIADVDSWQFRDGAERFPGRMGTPGHTAPERIGAPAGTAPDDASDDFVLAVLVHQVLMCGLHPFAGHPADGGDYLSYDDNVLRGRCRLLDRGSVVLPRSAPPADLLPRRLLTLFRAAFGGTRPTAAAWAEALAAESAPGRLRTCAANPCHVHTVERPWCPWCDLAERGTDSCPAPHGPPGTHAHRAMRNTADDPDDSTDADADADAGIGTGTDARTDAEADADAGTDARTDARTDIGADEATERDTDRDTDDGQEKAG